VEILRMGATFLDWEDLAELEPAENKTDFTLRWNVGPFMKDIFPIFKRWRQLRRLTLDNADSINSPNNIFPPFEVLSDFIMEMSHLSYLHIVPHSSYRSDVDQLKILYDKVNELILPRRPNFKFDISRLDY
jgi:hypothetical protein